MNQGALTVQSPEPMVPGFFVRFCRERPSCRSPAAYGSGPHISHPLVPKSQWMTASPQGEAFVLCPMHYHHTHQGESFHQKASPLRVVLRAANLKSNDCRGQSHLNSKLSWTRLFGTESMTDVGVPAPLGRGFRCHPASAERHDGRSLRG